MPVASIPKKIELGPKQAILTCNYSCRKDWIPCIFVNGAVNLLESKEYNQKVKKRASGELKTHARGKN